jgi:hypothetical protein
VSDFGEPWHILDMHDHMDISRADEERVLCADVWPDQVPNLRRAVACVNALEGIADPAAFVERAKAIEVLLRRAVDTGAEDECVVAAIHTLNLHLFPAEIADLAAEWTPDV